MRRSGLAVAAAVMLSMVPAAPPALAAPFSFNPAVITSDSGAVMQVSHRKHWRHCHRDIRNHGGGWHKHGKHCRVIFVRLHHHRHHHDHFGGACIRFDGVTLCFH